MRLKKIKLIYSFITITGRIFQIIVPVVFLLLSACATVRYDQPREDSYAMPISNDTKLAQEISSLIAEHANLSGFFPLLEGIDAFATRIGMARLAEKSIDVQYYIWRGDMTGVALAAELLQAADRGVRVRMLLDDLQISEHDLALRALDSHPFIEVRMFNPTSQRRFKGFEMLTRFSLLNRRMHNKCYIADNLLAVVGGRNIGDEYFNANSEVDFSDFDVLAVGPVVPEISRTFDAYWNSQLAVPINFLYRNEELDQNALTQLRQDLLGYTNKIQHSVYAQAILTSETVQQLRQKKAKFYWGDAHAVADTPEKFLADIKDDSTHLGPQLNYLVDSLDSEVLIISPYFVPGDALVSKLAALVKRGISVVIITNSLASNDVGIVHAAYAKYRQPLLQAGVKLYEFKASSTVAKKVKSIIPGSSRASLHAKVFIFNRQNLFVGSMNLDPRSAVLNSEFGVVIKSPEMASDLAQGVIENLPSFTYRLFLDGEEGDQQLRWESITDGHTKIYTSEPNASIWRKMSAWFMAFFVPEYLL